MLILSIDDILMQFYDKLHNSSIHNFEDSIAQLVNYLRYQYRNLSITCSLNEPEPWLAVAETSH